MKKIICILSASALFMVTAHSIEAQVAINNSSAISDASAILDLNSGNTGVNKGFLPPQVALNATNVAAPVTSPATGLIVYNSATAGTIPYNVTPGYYYWNGSQWMIINASITASGTPWLITGNYGTTVGTNFIGTNDNNDLEFKINNRFSGLIDSSLNNTFFGFTSGMANSTGTQNTALGYQALALNTVGSENTATGVVAMSKNTTGSYNTANGYQALYSNTGGYYNTAIGYYALAGNTTGFNNVAIGTSALYNNTNGSSNTAIGFNAGVASGPVTNATAIGANSIINYSNSVVLGSNAVTQTQFNGALMPYYTSSYQAGATGQVLTSQGAGIAPQWVTPITVQTNVKDSAWLLTGNAGTNRNKNFLGTVDNNDLEFKINNTFSGLIDDSLENTFLGYQSGQRSMHYGGSYNTGIGYQALYSDSTGGGGNVAIGNFTLYHNTIGHDNTALGYWALWSNSIGDANVAVGQGALEENTTGSSNVANGVLALFSNSIGGGNTAIGFGALEYNTTGSYNTAMGGAMGSNTTGSGNTASGVDALNQNKTGNYNTASGEDALFGNKTGSYNSVNGFDAMSLNDSGSYNVAEGMYAMFNNTTGSYNTAIGYYSNVSSGSLANATAIGANSVASSSNSVVLGSTAVTQTQFNGALMPNYSGNYQAGASGQVLTSQGAGVAPQWATPSNGSLTYATGAQTFVNNSDPQSNTTQGYSCTTILTSVPSATITLSVSGTYLIMANADCGSYAASSGSAVGIALTDGTNYWGSNQVVNPGDGSSTFNWVPWSTTTVVTISINTTYNIEANSPSSGTGYVRNARVTAIKLQ